MADPKPKREDRINEQQAERFDPTKLHQAEQDAGDNHELSPKQEEILQDKLNRADKQLENYSPDGNIDDVRQQEAALTSGLYTGSGRAEKKETVSLKTVFKKKGPLGALIALGLGLPTALTIFLSPALLLQQLAETMTGEFNDQLAALDARSTHLLKKKFSAEFTKGIACGTKVTIKCKYQSIRENSGMAKRLKKAGVEIRGDRSIIPGRIKPTHFVFEGKPIEAKDLLNEARKNPALRSALRKGYDPLYAAFSDKIAGKVRTKLGIKRSSDVRSSADQDKMNEDLKKTASGDLEDLGGEKLQGYDKDGNPTDDPDKIESYGDDSNKNKYSKSEGSRLNSIADEVTNRNNLAGSVKKAAIKSSVKSALTITALGAGAIDSACTAWTTIRVAAFAAKIYQQRQLIRYGYEFMKAAHKQKYGDLTAEEMAFYGDELTSTNSEGKSALDSDGYKFAAYGDVFSPGDFNASVAKDKSSAKSDEEAEKILLQNETSRYVNGQLLNDNLMSKLANMVSGSSSTEKADKACGFVKSWKGQAIVVGLAVAGAALGVITGGATIGWGTGVNAAAQVAISVAFALIQPKLLDMAKGEVIRGDENGNEIGNAITSSQGAYNAQASQGRALGVATQKVYTDYRQLNEKVIAKNAEIDRSERSPFDLTSKNTFLGSIVSSILPYTTKMSSIGSASLAASSFVASSFASLGIKQAANAAGQGSKYSQCDDYEYKGLAADPFCNLRYAIPTEDLKIDPDDVLDFMVKGKYITETDPTPLGDYESYVKKCFDRENSIGDASDSSEGDGNECIIGKGGSNEYRNKMFRLFYLDQSIDGPDGGMENDFEAEGGVNNSSDTDDSGASFSGDIAWPLDKRFYLGGKADWLGPHEEDSGTWTNGVNRLAVDIGDPDDGTHVYAMLGGTVKKADLGGHGLSILSQVDGESLEIAYAHGPRLNNKTSYEAGERISEIGCLGNCSGGHLHIDMAYNGKGICPQDVFLAMENNEPINWNELTKKAQAPCSGRI